jgi:PPM family protein phosphatase
MRLNWKSALADLNQAILNAMQGDPVLQRMGATVAGVVMRNGEALVFNIGDSRIYMENAGYLRLPSIDDSPVAHLVGRHERTGQISHGTQCLGGAESFRKLSPDVATIPFWKPTRLLTLFGRPYRHARPGRH